MWIDTGYWIVRSSWNTDYGKEGYIWFDLGVNACNIATLPSYTTVEAYTARR